MPEPVITVSKAALEKAFWQWELNNRTGKCRTPEEAASLALADLARESADEMWRLLVNGSGQSWSGCDGGATSTYALS